MILLGPLALVNPFVLLGLLLLPLIWRLLRLTPPRPKPIRFPAIRLLQGLKAEKQTSHNAPWWLILLRLCIVALIIIAVARPVLNPSDSLDGSGPLMLVIEDGWSAAPSWEARQRAALALIDRAERRDRLVVIATTAPVAVGAQETQLPDPRGPISPAAAREIVSALTPHPWRSDLGALVRKLTAMEVSDAHIAIIADGMNRPGREELLALLRDMGSVFYLTLPDAQAPLVLGEPTRSGAQISVPVYRLGPGGNQDIRVLARGPRGDLRGVLEGKIAAGQAGTELDLTVPLKQGNQLQSLVIEGQTGAGAVSLLGSFWRRYAVGVVDIPGHGGSAFLSHPNYFILRALAPYAEITQGALSNILKNQPAVIYLSGEISASQALKVELENWVRGGGILVRFAAEGRLPDDTLLPVRLRRGDRAIGGALSWERPQHLAPFPQYSPFAGLAPLKEVTVSRQLLAEPSPELAARSWARLKDGTPLVTGSTFGDGAVVLFHVTGTDSWSDLPLSGLFVEMQRRILRLADQPAFGTQRANLPPAFTLDGFGNLGSAPPEALALAANAEKVGPRNPPGLYGMDGVYTPHNLTPELLSNSLVLDRPAGVTVLAFTERIEREIAPWILMAVLVLLIVDGTVTLLLQGRLSAKQLRGIGAVVVMGAAFSADTAHATSSQAALQTRLAYVITGEDALDRLAEAGLSALSRHVTNRTAVTLADPHGVDLARDVLALYPLLYWPLSDGQPVQDRFAMQRLRRYLDHGGMLLIDSRDRQAAPARLRRLLAGLEVPPLIPLPTDHVLTRSFYLMRGLPGRFAQVPIWIGTASHTDHDGVSRLIIGGNDWIGAWSGLLQPVPGGERQREMAYRFGINLVIYALTGNYKADQVHLPAILERLEPFQ